jgi:hypothetical protein
MKRAQSSPPEKSTDGSFINRMALHLLERHSGKRERMGDWVEVEQIPPFAKRRRKAGATALPERTSAQAWRAEAFE